MDNLPESELSTVTVIRGKENIWDRGPIRTFEHRSLHDLLCTLPSLNSGCSSRSESYCRRFSQARSTTSQVG